MHPPGEGVVPDLFTSPITNPIGICWNKKHKVSKDRSSGWLANMLLVVGLPKDLFSNKSGRTTLITRLAVQGVPNAVGMMIFGHHTEDGYSRYDRIQHLKMEAATLVSCTPGLDYDRAMKQVTERFIIEKVKGNLGTLKPLIALASSTEDSMLQIATKPQLQIETKPFQQQEGSCTDLVKVVNSPQKLEDWHKDYDLIDWENTLQRDPALASALFGRRPQLSVASVARNSFANCSNCTINIVVNQPDKRDKPLKNEETKENCPPL